MTSIRQPTPREVQAMTKFQQQIKEQNMDEAHTPGPWSWGKDYRGLYGSGEENIVLNHAPYEGMWLYPGSSEQANARLIAAAPELLAACQQFMHTVQHPEITGSPGSVLENMRAAIAKAVQP